MPTRTRTSRDDLLRAGLELFARQGISATTAEELLAASGASVGSLYHHFGGKQGLATALFVDCLASYQQGAMTELRPRRSLRSGIRALVAHHHAWIEAHPERASFLLNAHEVDVTAPPLVEHNRIFFDALRSWLEPRSERIPPIPVLASLLIGPSQEYGRHWLNHRGVEPPTSVAKLFAGAAWAALEPLLTSTGRSDSRRTER